MKRYRFVVEEYVGGQYGFPTPCPLNMVGKYTHLPITVGSRACERCENHLEVDGEYVKCKARVSVLP